MSITALSSTDLLHIPGPRCRHVRLVLKHAAVVPVLIGIRRYASSVIVLVEDAQRADLAEGGLLVSYQALTPDDLYRCLRTRGVRCPYLWWRTLTQRPSTAFLQMLGIMRWLLCLMPFRLNCLACRWQLTLYACDGISRCISRKCSSGHIVCD